MDRNLARFPKESKIGLSEMSKRLVKEARARIDPDKMDYKDIDFLNYDVAMAQIKMIKERERKEKEKKDKEIDSEFELVDNSHSL